MFQTNSNNASPLQNLLNEELQCFTAVLQFSQKFVRQIKTLPVSVLADMVKYRQEWIDKIQQLEERRKTIDEKEVDAVSKEIIKKISKTAEKLVKIDERIYENMQQRKLKFVQEHSEVAGEAAYTRKQAGKKGQRSRVLDIVQE